MKKALPVFLLILGTLAAIAVPVADRSPDAIGAEVQASPCLGSQQMNRLRVVMTTTSDWSRLTVPSTARIVNSNGSRTSGSAGIFNIGSQEIFVGLNLLGTPTTVQYDILLTTDGVSDGTWQITKGWGQSTHADVYNINDLANPVKIASVDDREPQGNPFTFIISAASASQSGPLSADGAGPRQVIALYFPWYYYSSWDSSRTIDRPAIPYSVRVRSDVERIVGEAAASGIDGFTTSYQGISENGAPFQTLIDVANQRQDFKVSAYMETAVANAAHSETQPTDPAYMRQWITEVVQNYASAPSYLKMNGKPVIFIYRARNLTPSVWRNEVFGPLRARGIDAFYVGDYVLWDNVAPLREYLSVFDGLHSFNPSMYTTLGDQALFNVLSTNSLATQTHSLLNDPGGPRKLWVGTVVPGFDDTHIRTPGRIIPRLDGNFYQMMWDTNLSTCPDWIMITTWNDYFENTHIEKSVSYGSLYTDLTRQYSALFKSDEPYPHLAIVPQRTYWADYLSYLQRRLSVDFRVDNSGPVDARNMEITKLTGTNGVTVADALPILVGDVPPGGSKTVVARWSLPLGVTSFKASVWAQAFTPGGTTVYYP